MKMTLGQALKYNDAEQQKASLTWGKGNLATDGFNVLVNAELYRNNEMFNKDRSDRAWIGHADLRQWGYAQNTQFAAGAIIANNNAGNSPAGSIRNPSTLAYTSLPGCAALSVSLPQDPNGGCLWHQDQFRSMQPQIDGANLYTLGTLNINADLQVYAEAGYSKRDTSFTLTPPGITGAFAFPPNAKFSTGVANWTSGAGTTMTLGATHLLRTATSHSTTSIDIVDFKASRELMPLPGGALGIAVGAEYRKEKLDNPSLSGSENGSINSSYFRLQRQLRRRQDR